MLSSRYRLVRKLAEGGMAEILLADYENEDGLTRQVVVKRILAEFSKDQAFATMFMSEAKLVAKFHHPNIVGITDFGIDEGRYFLAMEYVDGFHLRSLFKRAEALGRPVPFDLAAKMVAQACQGLGYAHTFVEDGKPLNLIHRDVSPENLLIGRNGVVKVADFGIARIEGQVRTTRAGMVKGKLAYMAPEQLVAGQVDHRVDIFAMGIVLFELCCGHKPFDGPTDGAAMQAIIDGRPSPLSAFRPDAPPALQEIIDRAMASAPHDRYQSCAAMQQALEKFSSRTSAQALAVFVADIAPVDAVSDAKTGLVEPPGPSAAPEPPKTVVRTPNVHTALTVVIEPEPPAARPKLVLRGAVADTHPSRPAVPRADPTGVADTLPPRMAAPAPAPVPEPAPIFDPRPVANAPAHLNAVGLRPVAKALVMAPAAARAAQVSAEPVAPATPELRPLEPSGEIMKAAGLRRSPPWGVIAGAGVLLLVVGSFVLGRMGGSEEKEAKPEPSAATTPAEDAKPAEEPKPIAEVKPAEEPTPAEEPNPAEEPKPAEEPTPAENAKPAVEPAPAPKPEPAPTRKPPPAKPEVRVAAAKKPPPRAEKPVAPAPAPAPAARPEPRAPAPEPARREPPAQKFSGAVDEWSGLGAPPATSAPTPRELVGRVEYRASMGYVVSNDSDFVWHRCEIRLPHGKFYPFNAIALEPRRQYNLREAVLQIDSREADAYIIQGYAQLRCDEGRKYILVAN